MYPALMLLKLIFKTCSITKDRLFIFHYDSTYVTSDSALSQCLNDRMLACGSHDRLLCYVMTHRLLNDIDLVTDSSAECGEG